LIGVAVGRNQEPPTTLEEMWERHKRNAAWVCFFLVLLFALAAWGVIAGMVGAVQSSQTPFLGTDVDMRELVGFWHIATNLGGNAASRLALFDGPSGLKTTPDIQPIPAETTFEKAQWSRGHTAHTIASLHHTSLSGPHVLATYNTLDKTTTYLALAGVTPAATSLPVTYDATAGVYLVADDQGPGIGLLTLHPVTGMVVDLTAANGAAYGPAEGGGRQFLDMTVIAERIFISTTTDREILEFERATGQFIAAHITTPTFAFTGTQFQWPVNNPVTAADYPAFALDEANARLYAIYGQQYRLLGWIEADTLADLATLIGTGTFTFTFSQNKPMELLHGLAWVPES